MPSTKPDLTARDYWALPEGVRAELIDGELWDLAAPNRLHQEIVHALDVAFVEHNLPRGGSCKVDPATFAANLFADDGTFVEPDVSVVCDRSKLSDRGCEGAPDLVVEVVSPSISVMDYITKLGLYRNAGVREDWSCDPGRSEALRYDFGFEQLIETHDFLSP